MQTICVIDKRLNMVTLWPLEKFEHKLSILRDIYTRYIEEGSGFLSSSSSSLNKTNNSVSSLSNETLFISDSSDEWQKFENVFNEEDAFSPRMY
jgi:hypothetical protein